jgi:hypothetical protein
MRSRSALHEALAQGASRRALLLVTLCSILGTSLRARAAVPAASPAPSAAPAAPSEGMIEPIYDGGLKGRWQDLGWAPRDTDVGKPARLNLASYGGWILARRGLTGTFTAVSFRVLAPAKFGAFLEVRVASEADDTFPRVQIGSQHRRQLEGGWVEVRVPLTELNPKGVPFDRLVLRASKPVDSNWVEVNNVGLMGAGGSAQVAASGGRDFPTHRVSMQIDCTQSTRSINPMIYGIAYNPRTNSTDAHAWRMSPTARRWGGNPASRYNWKLGNAWNTGSDWFFMNVNYTGNPSYSWQAFLDENRNHGVQTALTVPMLGWVAKDTKSYAYPVSIYGPQRARYGANPDAGNGVKPNGLKIEGADPRRTSIPAPPEFVGEWVQAIRRYDEDNNKLRSVNLYYLDNEPSLWNSTHRDVHPEPVSYDELIKRTIAYGSQVRQADPQAVIAGPADWGWTSYFYSAVDAAAGLTQKPDRKMHNDAPLLAWYLQQLRAHEEKTGERVLNVLDVHYYPQGDGLYGAHERNDPGTAERRIRAVRGLWDPTYKDESWINDRVRLIPRLKSLIQENYPGLEVGIGEYSFGGERHMSGALAEAEVLGRFGQEGVSSAFYWTYPSDNSCTYHAFRAYRNYDGLGGHFLERSIPTTGDRSASLFASQDDLGTRIVAIALNFDPREGADANIDLAGCGDITSGRTFQYTGGVEGIRKVDDKLPTEGRSTLHDKLPPYSITIFEITVGNRR